MSLQDDYYILRRDRTGNGGRVMVLVRKSMKLTFFKFLADLEVIHFQISLNSINLDFLCCYNPNFNVSADFLSKLETYLLGLDLT